jgi:hypothetical protein
MKRYSLVDKPISLPTPTAGAPSVVIEGPSGDSGDLTPLRENTTSPGPETPPPVDERAVPAMASSLAALKKSDTLLERRASKRFSTYNISKMTGGSGRSGGANRKSMAAGGALTGAELASLAEADEADDPETSFMRDASRSRSRNTSPFKPPPVPPLPPSIDVPVVEAHTLLQNGASVVTQAPAAPLAAQPPAARPNGPFHVFLQVGREVKKVMIDSSSSITSLRMLFLDRFSYNPGKENFPAIYIRDPSSGVQYELEDMEEVKEKCLLSLNIERESRHAA